MVVVDGTVCKSVWRCGGCGVRAFAGLDASGLQTKCQTRLCLVKCKAGEQRARQGPLDVDACLHSFPLLQTPPCSVSDGSFVSLRNHPYDLPNATRNFTRSTAQQLINNLVLTSKQHFHSFFAVPSRLSLFVCFSLLAAQVVSHCSTLFTTCLVSPLPPSCSRRPLKRYNNTHAPLPSAPTLLDVALPASRINHCSIQGQRK